MPRKPKTPPSPRPDASPPASGPGKAPSAQARLDAVKAALGNGQVVPEARLLLAALAIEGRPLSERELREMLVMPSGDIDVGGRQLHARQVCTWRDGVLAMREG